MRSLPTPIPGLLILEPTVFGDERGYFYEAYNRTVFSQLGIDREFVQDNQSRSPRGILRGLHYQIRQPQDKLVRCTAGAVFDAVVDLRHDSPTFGRWFGLELSAANKRMLWVPRGFAHGFLVTSDSAEVLYKVTDFWSKDHERGLRWDDPAVAIAWPDTGTPPTLNARDASWPLLSEIPDSDLPGRAS
jgi:dTDP-4-dehydrorhamnose 3,5-epimerase